MACGTVADHQSMKIMPDLMWRSRRGGFPFECQRSPQPACDERPIEIPAISVTIFVAFGRTQIETPGEHALGDKAR